MNVLFPGPANLANCREAIPSRLPVAERHQCERRATVFRCIEGGTEELGFCFQHDPAFVLRGIKERREYRAAVLAEPHDYKISRHADHTDDSSL